MKKCFKIVLINLLLLLAIFVLFPNISLGGEYTNKADIKNKQELKSARENAVGKTIGFTSSVYNPKDEAFGLFDDKVDPPANDPKNDNDQIYCLRHWAKCQSGLYTITNYVHIVGDKSIGYYKDKNGTLKNSTNESLYNKVFWYIIVKEDYPKWYDHTGIRDRAIHNYFQRIWYEQVGKEMGISDIWHNNSESSEDNTESNAFIQRGEKYAGISESGTIGVVLSNFINSDEPSIECNKKTILYDNYEDNAYLGPIDIKFTGEIQSITAVDSNGKTISELKLYDCCINQDINNISEITKLNGFGYYESSFKIKKDSNTSKIKKIIVKLKEKNVQTADMWFIETNEPSQRLVIVEGGEEKISSQAEIIVEKKGSITINKKDSSTKDLIKPKTGFIIRKNAGKDKAGNPIYKWVRGHKNISYVDYPNSRTQELKGDTRPNQTAGIYYTTNGTLALYNLDPGTYVVYEIEAPTGYDLKEQVNYDPNNPVTNCETNLYKDKNSNIGIDINNNNISIDMYNKKSNGSLTIIKKDEYNTKKNEDNSSSYLQAGFMIKTDIGWLRGGTPDSNYTYTYNEPYDKATIYRTTDDRFGNTTDYVLLRELDINRTYTVYEVEAPEGYDLQYQANFIGKDEENNPTKNNSIKESRDVVVCKKDGQESFKVDNEDVKLEVFNTKVGDITIFKKDFESENYLTGAGFKIRTTAGENTWLSGTKFPYRYDATYDEATTYYIEDDKYEENQDVEIYNDSERGKGVKINKLKDGEYHIYEVDAPEGYYLEDQDGLIMYYRYRNLENETEKAKYKAKYENGRLDTGLTFTLPTYSNQVPVRSITRALDNIKRASLSGYVWIDTAQNIKEMDTNNVWDTDEEKVSGVTVKLYEKGNSEPIATTETIDGKYEFKEVIKRTTDKVYFENYYVEFDYSNLEQFKEKYNDSNGRELSYIKYIPVAFNATNQNGSKAIAQEIPIYDIDFNGIVTTYNGTGDNTKENTYGLATCGNYNSETKTLENINLGIKEIPKPNFDITENIATVKISLNGFECTYVYGDTEAKPRVYAPTVTYQGKNNVSAYERSFYPSDVLYEKKESGALKVEVKYRIDIKNTETMNIEEKYQEQTMYLKQLTNKFDTSRYILNDNNWVGNGDTATVTDNYLKSLNSVNNEIKGIETNETKIAYINFNVTHEGLIKILENPKGIIEDYPTKATATIYHKYARKDYSWYNDISRKQDHYTIDYTKDANAPYLIFKLGEDRIITGKVFKDNILESTTGEKLGNGKYEQNEENTIGKVKVELLDAKDEKNITNAEISNLYRVKINEDNTVDEIQESAVYNTQNNGFYELRGMLPGNYFVRFTYGDGSQKIYKYNNQEEEIGSVIAKDYKSTVVKSTKARDALNGNNSLTWYRDLEAENYSVAVDNIAKRIEMNTEIENNRRENSNVIADLVDGEIIKTEDNITEEDKKYTMIAGTAKMLIEYETDGSGKKYIEIKKDDGEKEIQVEVIKNEIKGINFGIIEQPINKAIIEKVITYVTLTNAQNNVVFDGNPETIDMQGVSDLDNKENGGSTYVRAEVIEDIIYSSKLELVYEVKVKNLSDVNYYTEDYYLFGDNENNASPVITLKVTNVKDYLDESLKYLPEKSSQDKIDKTIGKETLDKNTLNSRNTQVLTLSNWKQISRDEEDSVTITAERSLSVEDKDMDIVNEAEIIDIKRADDDGNIDEEKLRLAPSEIHTNGRVKVVTSITPPTGKNKQIITYLAIAGIATLILLSVGIVIIKRKNK